MLMKLDFGSDVPIYQQIRNQIVNAIASEKLLPGDKIPAIRVMADEAGVNMMTVNKAYALLKQEGYIKSERRGGTVVAEEFGKGGLGEGLRERLRVIASEARLAAVSEEEFIKLCGKLYRGKI